MNRRKVGYWAVTLLVILPQIGAALGYLAGAMDEALTHLGYPLYFAKILGGWKIIGAVTILAPLSVPWMKELKTGAYVGFFIVLTSAVVSHLAVGDGPSGFMPPAVMAGLLIVSFALLKRREAVQNET